MSLIWKKQEEPIEELEGKIICLECMENIRRNFMVRCRIMENEDCFVIAWVGSFERD